MITNYFKGKIRIWKIAAYVFKFTLDLFAITANNTACAEYAKG